MVNQQNKHHLFSMNFNRCVYPIALQIKVLVLSSHFIIKVFYLFFLRILLVLFSSSVKSMKKVAKELSLPCSVSSPLPFCNKCRLDWTVFIVPKNRYIYLPGDFDLDLWRRSLDLLRCLLGLLLLCLSRRGGDGLWVERGKKKKSIKFLSEK